jgi:hypothetical protein
MPQRNLAGLLLAALFLALLGTAPALAQSRSPEWRTAMDRLAAAAASPPTGVTLRSLAVSGIREVRTQARWPLSDFLERDLADALAAKNPGFIVLGRDRQPEIGRSAASGQEARDAVLTGTFSRADGLTRISLQVQDIRTKATLFPVDTVLLADASLPPKSAPAKGFGRLVIEVEPATAQVYLDGDPVSHGSAVLAVPLGSHVITVAQEGYEVYDEPVEVRDGAPAAVSIKLKRPSVTATIEANVPGAAVRIDGEDRGVTPLSVSGLGAGKHKVAISKEGYRPLEVDAEWTAGKPQILKAQLTPIPGSLVVTSDVGDARVELDGADVGAAPVFIAEVAPGSHKLRVTAGDRAPFEQAIDVRTARATHVRARLGPESGADASGTLALAVVPKTRHPDDLAFASAVQAQLQERHPTLDVAAAGDSQRVALLTFPEDEPVNDMALVRKFAQTIKARKVAVVGLSRVVPFGRIVGVWPVRPIARSDVEIHQGYGPRYANRVEVSYEGGEPWLGSEVAPDRKSLEAALAANVADTLAGVRGRDTQAAGDPLLNTLSAFLGDTRAGIGAGLMYERRVWGGLEVGAGYAYGNNFGGDFRNGTRLSFSGAGNDLLYGIGHAHQGRLDAVWRFDGKPPERGPWFEGPRWAPYVGAGFRLNAPIVAVFGVNRKTPEGGFLNFEPRGVILGGLKSQLGGMVVKTEVEVPVAAVTQDPATPGLTLSAGWLF